MKKVWQRVSLIGLEKGLRKGLKIVLKKDLKKGFIDCLIRRLECRNNSSNKKAITKVTTWSQQRLEKNTS